jgi:hypothetical protein
MVDGTILSSQQISNGQWQSATSYEEFENEKIIYIERSIKILFFLDCDNCSQLSHFTFFLAKIELKKMMNI